MTTTENRAARAWYVKYPGDAYALGPYRFDSFVRADTISDRALSQFGERPAELWPSGPTRDVPDYEYEVQDEQPE